MSTKLFEQPTEIPEAFKAICEYYTCAELEKDLKELVHIALTTDNLTYDTGKKRGNLITLHELLVAANKEIYRLTGKE